MAVTLTQTMAGARTNPLTNGWVRLALFLSYTQRTWTVFADNLLQRNKSEAHYRQAFVESLDIPAPAKTAILALTPAGYTGNAAEQAKAV